MGLHARVGGQQRLDPFHKNTGHELVSPYPEDPRAAFQKSNEITVRKVLGIDCDAFRGVCPGADVPEDIPRVHVPNSIKDPLLVLPFTDVGVNDPYDLEGWRLVKECPPTGHQEVAHFQAPAAVLHVGPAVWNQVLFDQVGKGELLVVQIDVGRIGHDGQERSSSSSFVFRGNQRRIRCHPLEVMFALPGGMDQCRLDRG